MKGLEVGTKIIITADHPGGPTWGRRGQEGEIIRIDEEKERKKNCGMYLIKFPNGDYWWNHSDRVEPLSIKDVPNKEGGEMYYIAPFELLDALKKVVKEGTDEEENLCHFCNSDDTTDYHNDECPVPQIEEWISEQEARKHSRLNKFFKGDLD